MEEGKRFAGQAALCDHILWYVAFTTAPCPYGPRFLPTPFFVLRWRRTIFLFQPLFCSHCSDLKPGGTHCKKRRVADTSLARHPSVGRGWSPHTRTHLSSFFGVVLQQRTWALGRSLIGFSPALWQTTPQ